MITILELGGPILKPHTLQNASMMLVIMDWDAGKDVFKVAAELGNECFK